jgi:hypothetical protein
MLAIGISHVRELLSAMPFNAGNRRRGNDLPRPDVCLCGQRFAAGIE